MSDQANQILDKIQEVADEKLNATKSEHIFIEQGIARIKQIIADLATKQEEEEDA